MTDKKRKKQDPEIKKLYDAKDNRRIVSFKVTPEQKALLRINMEKEGWENMSGYIKYKLFGLIPENRIHEVITRKNKNEIVILLRETVLGLVENFIYFRQRYEKDMNQLWKEEGVDLEKWEAATNRWNAEASLKIQEVLDTCRKIAASLRLKEYFRMPSESIDIDIRSATKEELDQLAEQLRKERIAMGRTDDV